MTEEQVIEPLAKFHIRITSGRRFTLPRETRDLYSIKEGYYVELIIRKIDPKHRKIVGRGLFAPKVSTNGVITIPKALVEELEIQKGEVVEILLINYIAPTDIFKKLSMDHAYNLLKGGFSLLDSTTEKEYIKKHSTRVE